MFRRHCSIAILSCLAVCGLVQGQQPKVLKEWEFPAAENHRGTSLGKVFVSDHGASKPFEEVWTHYAKKIGYTKKYEPNLTHSGGAGQYEIQILNSTNDPGVTRRPSTKSATLIRRGGGESITVFMSRAKDEEKTYITLIVEGK